MTQNKPEKLRAIIVDDEDLARRGLELRMQNFQQVEVLRSCASAKEAIDAIIELEPDIAFLDIQMPGMNGFDMIGEIQSDILPMIVFVTAYDAFALDAFKLHALDYLLKPVEEARLEEAITKAIKLKALHATAAEKQKLVNLVVSLTGKSPQAIGELLNDDSGNEHADRLAIKDGSSITFVPVREIDWVDAAGDYMCVHAKGATHIMRTTMKELEAKLDPAIFQRVHRSTIVNLERVEKVSSHINGEFHLTLSCGSSLKMSRSYKEKIKHFF